MKADSKRKTKSQPKKKKGSKSQKKKPYNKISSMSWKTSRVVANKSEPNINDWKTTSC